MATTIQVGQVWDVPFTVTRNGVEDASSTVQVGSSFPSGLAVSLSSPRTLRVTALAATNSVVGVVKTDVGTGAQVDTAIQFQVITPPIIPAVVVFGVPVQVS